jgi:iron complex outermembrane receptor protein
LSVAWSARVPNRHFDEDFEEALLMNSFRCSSRCRAVLSTISFLFSTAAFAQHDVEEIVVTATTRDQTIGDIAQSVTVVAAEELNRVRATNLGETLESQLGMSASYFGTGASRPIIRGLAGARVRTMEDGIESMDVSTVSDDHAASIDPLIARQIEIFRGPTTLLYGSGAVGGVVNTVTNRIPEAAPDDGFEGAFELRGDTAANERAGALALDGGAESFAWHFDAAARDTGDYEIPGFAELLHPGEFRDPDAVAGVLENSDLELTSYAFGGSWLGERGFFGVAASGFETNYGVPHDHTEPPPGVPPEPEVPVRVDLDQTRVDLKGGWSELGGGIEGLNLRIGINDYEHVELEGAEVGTRFLNDAYEGRLELLHSPFGMWSGAFGLQVGEREFLAIGDEAFVPPVDTATIGLFVVEQRDTERWQLSLGARLESQEHTPSSGLPQVDETAASFSMAAIRELGAGFALAINVASAERLPVAEELYADGPHLASGAIEVGDPSLGVETSRHFDVGIRKSTDELSWTITAFMTDYDDFIFLGDTGLVDPVENLPIFNFSQQDADFAGVEAELFAPIAQVGSGELDLRLFADYVDAEFADGANVPRIPPLRYGARLSYHTDRLAAGVEATEYDNQNEVAPLEEPTAGYTLVSADLEWSFAARNGMDLSMFLRGTNLLDEEARRHTSLVKDLAPLPGRNFAFGVRAMF